MLTFEELEKLSDNELREMYDKIAKSTVVGLDFIRDEIFRRDSEKIQTKMLKMTRTMRFLTVGIFLLTIINVIFVAVSVLKLHH